MKGTPAPRTTVRHRLAAVGAVSAALAMSPGVASAAPDRAQPPDVVPFVDCITQHADGTWTAIFGYDNSTGDDVDIPVGPANKVTPTAYDGRQPTHFDAGVHHGVVQVTVDHGGGPMWHLGSDNLSARKSDTACGPSTQMPADGNGTGVVVALGAAGIVGAGLVHRIRRRWVAPH